MPERQRSWITLMVLFIFFVSATNMADSNLDKAKCLPEQPGQIYLEEDEFPMVGNKGVPRDQVLLEINTATW